MNTMTKTSLYGLLLENRTTHSFSAVERNKSVQAICMMTLAPDNSHDYGIAS